MNSQSNMPCATSSIAYNALAKTKEATMLPELKPIVGKLGSVANLLLREFGRL
jgi:hypothetical protein